MKPVKIYIDASPLAEVRQTGIPHVTAELVRALLKLSSGNKTFKVVLIIAYDKRAQLKQWSFKGASYRYIPLPYRITNLVWKYNLLPPMDLLYGKGVYVFPNYRNWPLFLSKSLTYIHDLGFIRYPESVQPKNLEFLRNNINRWVKRATTILTGSEHAAQEILELLKPGKPVVSIYHGVDMGIYQKRSGAEVEKMRQRYGLPDEYLLYVGSLEPRKNLLRLINAYLALPDALKKKVALVLVGGGGWLNEDITEAIKAAQSRGENIVRPEQYIEDADLPALYSGAIALIHPALYEGFGLSPLQAMACGTPVVVADNSSLPEVVGKAALQISAEDEADISGKIYTILTDSKLRTSLSKEGPVQAAKFSWNKTAQQVLAEAQKVNQ